MEENWHLNSDAVFKSTDSVVIDDTAVLCSDTAAHLNILVILFSIKNELNNFHRISKITLFDPLRV